MRAEITDPLAARLLEDVITDIEAGLLGSAQPTDQDAAEGG